MEIAISGNLCASSLSWIRLRVADFTLIALLLLSAPRGWRLLGVLFEEAIEVLYTLVP